jgi:AcrR family transcriptional regulator
MPLKAWLQDREPIVAGRHGLPPQVIRQNQRGRLLEAVATLVAEDGVNRMTAARLSARAGVSRSTLYELFGSKDECFCTAARETNEHLMALMAAAVAAEAPSPQMRVDRMVDALMTFCAEHPNAAQLMLTGVAAAGAGGIKRRSQWLDELTGVFRQPLAEAHPDMSDLTPEIFVGGLWHVAARHLRAGIESELPVAGRTVSAYLLGRAPAAGEAG